MKQDDWRAESKLPNGGLRVRHFPTRAVFEVWMDGDQGCSTLYTTERIG